VLQPLPAKRTPVPRRDLTLEEGDRHRFEGQQRCHVGLDRLSAGRERIDPSNRLLRSGPARELLEVRAELGKVAWPTRKEVFTYTVVVLVSVAFCMAIIGGMDFISSKAVIELIRRGGN
jgi:preprotein translocase SecE subunit